MSPREQIGEWIFNANPRYSTISPDRQAVYSFDLEGRLISWYEDGRLFKRSLGSQIHGRDRDQSGRRRWVVPLQRAEELFGRVFSRISAAEIPRLSPELRSRLEMILTWTPQRLMGEGERFRSIYRPVGILPPDQYLAIVLQATFGCSWGRCTFCNFYQDRPFAVLSTTRFRDHVDAVAAFLGAGLALRRGIFLADGNALVLSNARLRPILWTATERFPGRDISGFVDVYTGERKSVADWAELRRLGLRRVHIGVETGHDPLLRWMNKSGSAIEAREFISSLKEAELQVAVVLICGAGGDRFAEAHIRDTIDLVAKLPIGAGDIVYLSPFLLDERSEYAARSKADKVRILNPVELEEQYSRLRDGIRNIEPRLKVARYDIREFVY